MLASLLLTFHGQPLILLQVLLEQLAGDDEQGLPLFPKTYEIAHSLLRCLSFLVAERYAQAVELVAAAEAPPPQFHHVLVFAYELHSDPQHPIQRISVS